MTGLEVADDLETVLRLALASMRHWVREAEQSDAAYARGKHDDVMRAMRERVDAPEIIGRVRWQKSLAAAALLAEGKWAHRKAQTYAAEVTALCAYLARRGG